MARARAVANSAATPEADVDAAGPRPGGRPRDAALDEAIILATRDRLIRDGYSRMTIGDIAADAKVSRPTLYRRWSTKFELVVDALDYGFRGQRDLYTLDLSELEPREALVEAVRRLDPTYHNPDAMVLMGNFAGEAIRTPELLEILRKHAVEPRVGLVENVLAQLWERGAVPPMDVHRRGPRPDFLDSARPGRARPGHRSERAAGAGGLPIIPPQ